MNTAEKIAGCYLRLNGFLLLPHFTVFDGRQHNHVDWIGLRGAGSQESCGDLTFPIDDSLFEKISEQISNARDRALGLVAEVRTNSDREIPSEEHFNYITRFLGVATVFKASFSESTDQPEWSNDCLEIGNRYALNWIITRITWMDSNCERLKKSGSWNLSDDWLGDLLVLKRYGAFERFTQTGCNEQAAMPDACS